MKRPHKIIGKTLVVSILSTGLGLYAGTVASDSTGEWLGQVGASSSLLYAQQYLNRDKPPYVRDSRYTQQQKKKQLEKSEFSRFEEKPAVTEEGKQPAYCYVPGRKPPYQINPKRGTPC
jgi:hypothetical protein